MKRIICNLLAIPLWVKMGFRKMYFRPHFYKKIAEYDASVYYDRKRNRVRNADTYTHTIDEEYIRNAAIFVYQCELCGKKAVKVKPVNDL